MQCLSTEHCTYDQASELGCTNKRGEVNGGAGGAGVSPEHDHTASMLQVPNLFKSGWVFWGVPLLLAFRITLLCSITCTGTLSRASGTTL